MRGLLLTVRFAVGSDAEAGAEVGSFLRLAFRSTALPLTSGLVAL